MNIEYVPIEDIKPYEKNAKIHSKSQIEKIAKSIDKFGWKQNLVIDKDGVLVVGHGRYEAAKLLGLDSVPCVRADDLTDDEIRAYRLADNAVSGNEYDDEILFSELQEIELDMSEFDLDTFSMDDIEEVTGYDKNNDDREYFEKVFTFPIEKKQQITNYLKKHYDEIIGYIMEQAETNY